MPEDSLAWTTVDSTVPYTCSGFDVRHDEVRLPDGEETAYDYLEEPPSVVIIPFTPGGEVIVTDEWRQAVGRVSRGFPAGGVEPDDDTLAAAAHRELREETGYVADRVDPLVTVEPANGITNSVHHYFVAEECIRNGSQDLDHDESILVDLTTIEHLRSQVVTGAVRDGRTVLGVLYYGATR